ncbi:MAG: RNA methyltransferase [Peptococcaceae bacterium]|nr:RNA methyltransferase [Peptococcaceae bacterium]
MSILDIALVHAPVYNKNMEVITSSVTNLDIHDIARCAATYGVRSYYIVHPSPAQHDLTRRIMGFWQEGVGADYNPDRREAFGHVKLVSTLQEVREDICRDNPKKKIYQVATDARLYPNTIGYEDLRERVHGHGREEEEAYLLVFGTGSGIVREEMERSDYILRPIYGPGDYNHLSVRSAAAIILDRLCGQ